MKKLVHVTGPGYRLIGVQGDARRDQMIGVYLGKIGQSHIHLLFLCRGDALVKWTLLDIGAYGTAPYVVAELFSDKILGEIQCSPTNEHQRQVLREADLWIEGEIILSI